MNRSIIFSRIGLGLLSLVAVCEISVAGVGTARDAEKPDVPRLSDSPAWDVSDYSGFSTGKGYINAYPAQTDLPSRRSN
jgi:hypothetical protein